MLEIYKKLSDEKNCEVYKYNFGRILLVIVSWFFYAAFMVNTLNFFRLDIANVFTILLFIPFIILIGLNIYVVFKNMKYIWLSIQFRMVLIGLSKKGRIEGNLFKGKFYIYKKMNK